MTCRLHRCHIFTQRERQKQVFTWSSSDLSCEALSSLELDVDSPRKMDKCANSKNNHHGTSQYHPAVASKAEDFAEVELSSSCSDRGRATLSPANVHAARQVRRCETQRSPLHHVWQFVGVSTFSVRLEVFPLTNAPRDTFTVAMCFGFAPGATYQYTLIPPHRHPAWKTRITTVMAL